MALSADALNTMLRVCEQYAGDHSPKSNEIIIKRNFTINNQSPGSIQFMRNKLKVIYKCTLPGVEVLNYFSADIDHSVNKFNS